MRTIKAEGSFKRHLLKYPPQKHEDDCRIEVERAWTWARWLGTKFQEKLEAGSSPLIQDFIAMKLRLKPCLTSIFTDSGSVRAIQLQARARARKQLSHSISTAGQS